MKVNTNIIPTHGPNNQVLGGQRTIKIWYQSLLPLALGKHREYEEALRRRLQRVADPQTEVSLHGIDSDSVIPDRFRSTEPALASHVLKNVLKASREQYDGFIIGNFLDAGLYAAREIADIPVLGLGETSEFHACQIGGRFGIAPYNRKWARRLVENLRVYGLERRLAGIRPLSVKWEEITQGVWVDPDIRSRVIDNFLKVSHMLVEDGAEVVIPGGGVIHLLLVMEKIRESEPGVPIIDGIAISVKMAEALCKLKSLGEYSVSRLLTFEKPAPEHLDILRKQLGLT